jgi:hypothetical protein
MYRCSELLSKGIFTLCCLDMLPSHQMRMRAIENKDQKTV